MQKNTFSQRKKKGFLKKLMIMKLTTMFLLLALLQARAGSYSQTITISLKNASVEKVFKEIQKQSDYLFFYNDKLIKNAKKISINVKDASVQAVLQLCFSEQPFSYAIDNKQIIIRAKEVANTANTQTIEQPKPSVDITGTITDADGKALAGATVKLKGTTISAAADQDGKFSIQSATNSGVLVISFVGFETREYPFSKAISVIIVLQRKELKGDEVIVIGYGTQKKSDLTGSVSSLKADDFNKGITTAPQQLMQGKITGVNISLNSGEPGANSSVLIRGGTSISASNRPLYVIDGVPVDYNEGNYNTGGQGNPGSDRQPPSANNPLNLLNPSDIKSIDVLKDASATAIYGSRGANGVIIVTTKQGRPGKASVEYDTYASSSSLRKKFPVLSADELRSFIKSRPDITGWVDGGTSTDWQDQIFRKGISQSHNLAFSGGSEKTSYRASVNYGNQEGIIINSFLQKFIGRININHKAINDKLNISLNMTGAQLNGENAPVADGTYGGGGSNLIRDALRYNPTNPVRDANGDYNFVDNFHPNPIEEANGVKNRNETFRFLGNLLVDYKLTSFLSVNTNVAFTKEYVDNLFYLFKSSRAGRGAGGFGSQQSRNNSSKLVETNVVFNKKFGEKHAINALAGYSYQEFFGVDKYNSASKFITDAFLYNNLGAGDRATFNIGNNKESNKLVSFYGRANYQYDNRYLFTATVRRDGSTRFGANNKWGTFPSAAIGWKISEEKFMKSIPSVSTLKLRVGYGVTGSQEIGNYRSLKTLSAGDNAYILGGENIVAVGPNVNPNPDLKWESTAQTNVGLDFGLFSNRLTGSIDYYNKKTSNLLLDFTVPSPCEVCNILYNVGQVNNEGIELDLKAAVVDKGPLRWDAYANISRNRNKVIALSNERFTTQEIYTGNPQAPGNTGVVTQVIRPGLPLGSWIGLQYIGPKADSTENFVDQNKDGVINGDDNVILGNNRPDFTYGFGSSFNYKRFSFDFSFYGIKGNTVLNSNALDLQKVSELPLANIAGDARFDGIKSSRRYSSFWLQNASFLRLENVSLGYNFNISSLKWLSRARVYLTGQNLWVITKYKGFDPEISGGTDFTKYPRPRTILLGLSVQF
jgi:TonB-dependent starch-binding outer membrane protein SusC